LLSSSFFDLGSDPAFGVCSPSQLISRIDINHSGSRNCMCEESHKLWNTNICMAYMSTHLWQEKKLCRGRSCVNLEH
jgi:hypothetical protein